MKKLKNTLYITSPDAYLSLDGENIVLYSDKREVGRVPLCNLENIVTFGRQGASPALMRKAAEYGIGLAFMSAGGRFLCRIEGERHGNVLLRREQYRVADDEERSLKIAVNMIGAKTVNSRGVLLRALRDHPLIPEAGKIEEAAAYLKDSLVNIRDAKSIDTLRGLEGVNASVYYDVFNNLILQNKKDFVFTTREKRPPTDNCNALLSFCYTLAANECASALEAAGLDPYVGFMHTDRPGRKSLALDLVEEFRSLFCDRFVISLINLRQIDADDFTVKENGAVLMSEKTRRTLLSAWQKKKQEIVMHPFLNEKCERGVIPFVQAQLLARHIRGELDEYAPFVRR